MSKQAEAAAEQVERQIERELWTTELADMAAKVGRLKAIALQYAAAAYRDSDLVNARRRIEDAAK